MKVTDRKVKKKIGQWKRTITFLIPNQVLKGPPFFETLLMKHSLLKKKEIAAGKTTELHGDCTSD